MLIIHGVGVLKVNRKRSVSAVSVRSFMAQQQTKTRDTGCDVFPLPFRGHVFRGGSRLVEYTNTAPTVQYRKVAESVDLILVVKLSDKLIKVKISRTLA